jgi:hypothetical protein
MKKILFISIFFLVAWFAYAQTIQVDENTIRQIIDILQKLVKEGQIQIPAPVKVSPEVEKKIEPVPVAPAPVIPAPVQLPAGVKPALPESIEAIPIPPENIKPVLPDEDREDDVIIQINNLRITRILLNPGIENVKAIFFAVRDTGWKCMLFESEESEKSLPCILDLRKSILQKELAIQITDDTILLQRNRRRAKLEDFNVGDKINVYGFMDKDNNGIDALIIRKIVEAPRPKTIPRVIVPNGGEKWLIGLDELIKWEGFTAKTVNIYIQRDIWCHHVKPPCTLYAPRYTIAKNVINDGNFTWRVGMIEDIPGVGPPPKKVLDPGDYIIIVQGNDTKESDESDGPFTLLGPVISIPSTSTPICIQVITPAYNPQNPLECKEFPTPCDVPSGWIKTEKCPATSTSP